MAGKYTSFEKEPEWGNIQGKYTEGGDVTRGIEELEALVIELGVDQEQVTMLESADKLLKDAANILGNIFLHDHQLREAFLALIQKIPFARVTIRPVRVTPTVGDYVGNQHQMTSIYLFGDYSAASQGRGGCFNVWFSLEEGSWYLNYTPVPTGGNLRHR